MPVEILETKEGYYIPMDGPWFSEEDNKAFAAAERKYEELIQSKEYVALIRSHHEYSHGYWLETKEKKVKHPDVIVKSNKK